MNPKLQMNKHDPNCPHCHGKGEWQTFVGLEPCFCDQRTEAKPITPSRKIAEKIHELPCHEWLGQTGRKLDNRDKIEKIINSEVIELALCEYEKLYLHPNELYRFVVMPDCKRCVELAELGKLPNEKS